MKKIKNGLTDKVKNDLISALEKMLSSDMINGLNTAKYKIGDILSYEKKKNSKRLDINLVEPKGNRVLSIYTGEKFIENKIEDSKSTFRDNQVYTGVLRSLSLFFKEIILEKNISLMASRQELVRKSLINLERLQELCPKPTRVSKITKWTEKELIDRLTDRYPIFTIKAKTNDEVMSRIVKLKNQVLEECFDLDVFNYIPKQTLLEDDTMQIELNYYNHCAILPGLEGHYYFKPGADMLTKDIVDDVLNRFPANGDSKDRFEDIYIPRKKYSYTNTNEIFTFISKINIDKSRDYTLIFNIDSDLLNELILKLRYKKLSSDNNKDLKVDDLIKFSFEKNSDMHNLIKLYFEKNSEMFKELRLYRDILNGSYKHTSLKTGGDRFNFIIAIEKNYPYLKDCREKGIIDTLLNASIFFKIEKTIFPGI
jgi:hypothetical protein